MTAVKPSYRSGWCTTGAASWSHVKCSGTYGHPPYEAACGCTCHDLTGAAIEYAKNSYLAIICADDDPAERYPFVAANLLLDLHAAYPSLWDVAIPPVEVPR